jgi:hypothetical protein
MSILPRSSGRSNGADGDLVRQRGRQDAHMIGASFADRPHEAWRRPRPWTEVHVYPCVVATVTQIR